MTPKEQVDAKKNTQGAEFALELASQVNHIRAAKGKSVVHIDMKKDKPDEEALKKVLLGPTGNLRAPTLRVGKTLLVGFDSDTYSEVLDT